MTLRYSDHESYTFAKLVYTKEYTQETRSELNGSRKDWEPHWETEVREKVCSFVISGSSCRVSSEEGPPSGTN